MYLHIGGEVSVLVSDVVGIFDIEATSTSRMTADFLSKSQKMGRIYSVTNEMPKAFVICTDYTYITNVSHQTLRKRLKTLMF